ncbi:response regulator [Methylobacterium planeticum]|uniref:Response regulator n=1 Tax=Methylobacterium planeticum TaxID=2615211 RepID=A0A6N6MRB8_9HYPH|nr:response regulator [Methylobacterium planeticum]KAB1072972.1 response regulator [Methylobacterium planeticum]
MSKLKTANRLVLVVEDDAIVRLVARDMLEDAGFEVLEADGADGALAVLEREPDVGALFTDVDMPGSMDGVALAARVAERWPQIRLVVTSGRTGMRDSDLPDAGKFLSKPYRQVQLVGAIASAV